MACQICINNGLDVRAECCSACDFENTLPAGLPAKRKIQRAVLAHHAGDARAAVWLRRDHYHAHHRGDDATETLLRSKGFSWLGGGR